VLQINNVGKCGGETKDWLLTSQTFYHIHFSGIWSMPGKINLRSGILFQLDNYVELRCICCFQWEMWVECAKLNPHTYTFCIQLRSLHACIKVILLYRCELKRQLFLLKNGFSYCCVHAEKHFSSAVHYIPIGAATIPEWSNQSLRLYSTLPRF